MRIALEEARACRPLEHVVVGLLDLRLPLDVGLIKVEECGLFLIDLLGNPHVAEQMRRQRSVDIMPDRLERHGDARQVQIVFAEASHGLEVEILPVDERHLCVVTEMELEFAAVVVSREPKLFKAWNDRLIDDLHDVGLLLERPHAVVEAPVLELGDGAVLLLPCPDDVRQVELHFHAGAVLDKRHAVAVADFTAHGG